MYISFLFRKAKGAPVTPIRSLLLNAWARSGSVLDASVCIGPLNTHCTLP